MTKPLDETLRIVWCPVCHSYLGEPNVNRVVLIAIADAHYKATTHGVWLEACGPVRHDRQVAQRRHDPAKRDDRVEEIKRGGV